MIELSLCIGPVLLIAGIGFVAISFWLPSSIFSSWIHDSQLQIGVIMAIIGSLLTWYGIVARREARRKTISSASTGHVEKWNYEILRNLGRCPGCGSIGSLRTSLREGVKTETHYRDVGEHSSRSETTKTWTEDVECTVCQFHVIQSRTEKS